MIRSLTFVLSLSSSVFAGTNVWFVDDDGKADFNTIQAAIDAAESGDYIAVMEGVYVESIDFLGKDITVEGESAEKVIIDGSKNNSSVVTFKNGESNQAMISRCTIKGGQGTFWDDPIFGQQQCGGGVYCEGSSPVIGLCNIQGNTAWGGGGIFVTDGNPLIMFNTIVNNYAEGHGGGIYFINESGGTIDSCEFKNNEANWGGGMTCTVNCDPTIVNSLFEANTTNNVGGGIFIRSSSSPLITDCEFINNIQVSNPLGSGGGVCIYGAGNGGGPCYPSFTRCNFEGNTVLGDGGGMSAAYDSNPKLTDCEFRFNSAGRSGGGLACVADPDYLYPSNADVDTLIVEFNTAGEEGGGIHVRYSEPILQFATVRQNTAGLSGGGINFFDSSNATLLLSNVCGNTPNQVNGSYAGSGNEINDECYSSCPADINEDGNVNVTDLLEVVASWGECTCPADINGDGEVNVTDVLIVISGWGPCQ